MYSREEHDYDYSCRVCGRGYYADLGTYGPPCGCDEDKFLREQEEERQIQYKKERKSLKSDDYLCEELDDPHWDCEEQEF